MRIGWMTAASLLAAGTVALAAETSTAPATQAASRPTAADSEDALSRELAGIRDRKEPLDLTDFAAKNVTPETNAVPLFRKAMESLQVSKEELNSLKLARQLPLTDSQRIACDAVLKKNAAALALLSRAAALPGVDWQLPFDHPKLEDFTALPYNDMRTLACLVETAALRAHEQGDDRAACARVREMLNFRNAVGEIPTMTPVIVCANLDILTADTLLEIIPDLNVGEKPGAVPVAEVRSLIRDLTDDAALLAVRRRQFWGERALSFKFSDASLKANPQENVNPRDLQAVLLSVTSACALAQNYPQAHKPYQDMEAFAAVKFADEAASKKWAAENPGPAAALLVRAQLLAQFDRSHFPCFRALANRSMAGIALAIHLYALDHQNKLPERLDDLLAAKLLPTGRLPDDPFSPTPAPFRYRPAETRPFLYDVGEKNNNDADFRFYLKRAGPTPP